MLTIENKLQQLSAFPESRDPVRFIALQSYKEYSAYAIPLVLSKSI